MDLHVATPTVLQSKSVVLFLPANDSEKETCLKRDIIIDSTLGKSISFVESARYLGHVVSEDLTDDKHLQGRMAKAYQVFGALRPQIFGQQSVWLSVKARVMETMVIPTLLDGVECSTISQKMMCELETMYLKLVRTCLKITP